MDIDLKASLIALTGAQPAGQRFLLAVSGGLDSVVLAHAFMQNNLEFGIAHCNFSLRGDDSDADEAFVGQLANQYACPFFARRFDTRAHARESGISIQMAARKLRYRWLESVRSTAGYDWIATAHQLDDALETFLINFIRGTGLRGLSGIPAKNERIIRPFLQLRREDLEKYYKHYHLTHREDRSNAETDYLRNKVRHLIVPVLLQIEPGILKKSAQNFEALHNASLLYDHTLEKIRSAACMAAAQRVVIDWSQIEPFPAPASILFELLAPFGFNAVQCRRAWEIRSGQPGKSFSSSTHILVIDRNHFILEPQKNTFPQAIAIEAETHEVLFPEGRLQFSAHTNQRPGDKNTAVIPTANLSYPIMLRKWRPGDRFCPSGLGGRHKKIQDLLTDLRLDRLSKQRIWVLENGDGKIIWVIGIRQDQYFTCLATKPDSCLEIRFFPTEIV
ncbi:MAG: tRNA lysidine(34) synthetase TilS [Saprospiraceae bacterium]|jgi:tRNA(Ile)-lysidine synthase